MSSHVLIIEDEPRIADFIVRGLGEEGYQVELATDGRLGVIALARGGWDLVILDWWLPREDGIDVLRQFRQRDRTTPVLFLTARDSVAHRVTGLDAGADDYLTKPFSFEELVARVRALLRRGTQSNGLVLQYADVQADLGSQTVTRNGQLIDLTAKEYSLLVHFLRHPRKVLTRSRIYESVWGDQYDGLSNTLEVHVKELRRKLEEFGPRLIQTRRGRGYILEIPSLDGE